MSKTNIKIREIDEAGNENATYVETGTSRSKSLRVDVIRPETSANVWQQLLGVFLPAGYPQSVTDDYLEYQIYDSLQAFSSSIAGLLSSRAVLQGVGVGDATASPTAALLLTVLQESMGRIATILFAHRLGTSLEPECKMYRLAADVFNDAAMILDCLSPAFPKVTRVFLLSFSSVLRALCGVAAGSSKASLSAHFARWGNLGELNAKDSSQETVISLFGMLVGSLVVSYISSPFATWSSLLLLLAIHLATNHAAVRAVNMRTLNRQRANIVFSNFLESGKVLSPQQVSKQERIFEWDGVLRSKSSAVLGHCRIGVSLEVLLASMGKRARETGSISDIDSSIKALAEVFDSENFIIWYNQQRRESFVVLKEECPVESQLRGWLIALSAHLRWQNHPEPLDSHAVLAGLKEVNLEIHFRLAGLLGQLREKGWDLTTAALETRSSYRIRVMDA